MAIITPIENGKVADNTSAVAAKKEEEAKKKNQGFDKEMFLKLLVAEMQYQDPLEPTSNSEYVSELASFSQIEAIQNVEGEMKNMSAASLVGQYVILLHTNSAGNSEWVSGKVDYVMNQDGDMYLSVNDKLYSIDELDSIADEQYYQAVTLAQSFADAVMALPNVNNLTLQDADKVKTARDIFDSLDTYQKQFVDEDAVKNLENIEKRMEQLRKAAGQTGTDKTDTDTTGAEETKGETESTDKVEGDG